MRTLILDIATAPLENIADYISREDVKVPGNYTKADSIRDFVDKEYPKLLEKAALDPDTCRITAIGWWQLDSECDLKVSTCRTEREERHTLEYLALGDERLVTFNGFKFDLPILMRRCAYLGLSVPDINLDRYRSSHVDLYDRLTYHGAIGGHSLVWYAKRLGWSDLTKPLTGAEEAQVPQTGRWDDLAASVRHDLTATFRLAQWLGVVPEPIL